MLAVRVCAAHELPFYVTARLQHDCKIACICIQWGLCWQRITGRVIPQLKCSVQVERPKRTWDLLSAAVPYDKGRAASGQQDCLQSPRALVAALACPCDHCHRLPEVLVSPADAAHARTLCKKMLQGQVL